MAEVASVTNDPGVRIVQCVKMESTSMLSYAMNQTIIVAQLVREVLAEVPDADFIEVRAIRYDVKEGNDERDITSVPPGQ
jgi:hypothetical protein